MALPPRSTGQALKEEGIDSIVSTVKAQWRNGYKDAAIEFINSVSVGETWMGEELREAIEPLIGKPHAYRAWGAMSNVVIAKWIKDGIIKIVGLARSRSPKNHAGLYPIYEKVK